MLRNCETQAVRIHLMEGILKLVFAALENLFLRLPLL